jgi:hypothetical protein
MQLYGVSDANYFSNKSASPDVHFLSAGMLDQYLLNPDPDKDSYYQKIVKITTGK